MRLHLIMAGEERLQLAAEIRARRKQLASIERPTGLERLQPHAPRGTSKNIRSYMSS